ncbi:MAG TPA: hypothetical protein VE995_00220 [Gaiellaceae bacterium]|nr:hypothetical protein [Gaiellaceae bacterium]
MSAHPRPRPLALVDARNVLRSTWPNIAEAELVELCRRWAAEEGCDALVVFDGEAPSAPADGRVEVVGTGPASADDRIVCQAARLRSEGRPFWLVTSDRELRRRAGAGAEQTIGGGTLARRLLALRS